MLPGFYTDKLYPLQDQVLNVVGQTQTAFYLTGGTALSRAWMNHRYSDDLDFFLNNHPDFSQEVKKLLDALLRTFGHNLQKLIDTASFHRWVLSKDGVDLKIELINDVGFRSGSPVKTPLFFQTDTIENIASNKISALSRNEPKDIADIVFLEQKCDIHWPTMIEDAKMKEVGINEIEIAAFLGNYNINNLSNVRWINTPNFEDCKKTLDAISEKILRG